MVSFPINISFDGQITPIKAPYPVQIHQLNHIWKNGVFIAITVGGEKTEQVAAKLLTVFCFNGLRLIAC